MSRSGHVNQNLFANWNTEEINQVTMDMNNNNQIPVNPIMSIPPYMLPQYRQANEEQTQREALRLFWQQRLYEIQNAEAIRGQHQLPLARIKRIMKADREVKMISGETPLVLAKACEMFIQELSLRAWMHTEQSSRRTMQRCDIANAITQNDVFDFLSDVVPMQPPHPHNKEEDNFGNIAPEGTHLPPSNNPMMMNMGIEGDSGNIVEGTQDAQPGAIVNDPMMNMGIDQGSSNPRLLQPFVMQPPSFMPSFDQFPYNFPPQ